MPLTEEQREKVKQAAIRRLQQPVDPFIGRSILDLLTQCPELEDPWVVGGTVWRPAYSVVRRDAAVPSNTDIDVLLASREQVHFLKTKFVPEFVQDRTPYGFHGTTGFRVHYNSNHMDVWTPPVGQARETHVMAFPYTHQRMYFSADHGIVDLRADAPCACPVHRARRARGPRDAVLNQEIDLAQDRPQEYEEWGTTPTPRPNPIGNVLPEQFNSREFAASIRNFGGSTPQRALATAQHESISGRLQFLRGEQRIAQEAIDGHTERLYRRMLWSPDEFEASWSTPASSRPSTTSPLTPTPSPITEFPFVAPLTPSAQPDGTGQSLSPAAVGQDSDLRR